MNCTYESYETKLDEIIKNLNSDNDRTNLNLLKNNNNDKDEVKKVEKNKQFETINYCYEMYKVRKNKKADFDIHSMNNLSIEDDDIDKVDKVLSWKDLDEDRKTKLIDDHVDYLYNIYSNKIKKEVIKNFILNNKSKIRYNKKDKKIDTIIGMICVNENELVIKKKITNSNELINKLRKSIKR